MRRATVKIPTCSPSLLGLEPLSRLRAARVTMRNSEALLTLPLPVIPRSRFRVRLPLPAAAAQAQCTPGIGAS